MTRLASGSDGSTSSDFVLDGYSTMSSPPEEWMDQVKTMAASVAASTAALTISSVSEDRSAKPKPKENQTEVTISKVLDQIDVLQNEVEKMKKDKSQENRATINELQLRLQETQKSLERARKENELLRAENKNYKIRVADTNQPSLAVKSAPDNTTSVTKIAWEVSSFKEKSELGEPIQSKRVQAGPSGRYTIYLSMHFIEAGQFDTIVGIFVHVASSNKNDDGAFPVSLSGTTLENWQGLPHTKGDHTVISSSGRSWGWDHFDIERVISYGLVNGSVTVAVTVQLQPVHAV